MTQDLSEASAPPVAPPEPAAAMAQVRRMMQADPDLNLYLLAFEVPDLEEAALAIAREVYGTVDTRDNRLAVKRLEAKIAAVSARIRNAAAGSNGEPSTKEASDK
jgi:hypothetical protein